MIFLILVADYIFYLSLWAFGQYCYCVSFGLGHYGCLSTSWRSVRFFLFYNPSWSSSFLRIPPISAFRITLYWRVSMKTKPGFCNYSAAYRWYWYFWFWQRIISSFFLFEHWACIATVLALVWDTVWMYVNKLALCSLFLCILYP